LKKAFAFAFCLIILCSILAATVLLKPQSTASLEKLETDPKDTPYPDLKVAPEETPQSTPQNKPQATETTPTQSPKPISHSTVDKLEIAINNTIKYIAQTEEPNGQLFLNILYRRFGITEFQDSLQRFDEILSSSFHPILKLYRRIADHNNTVDETDFAVVTSDIDKVIVPALYSDRRSLPDDYSLVLINAKNSGGYLMTHALLATIWLQENNCNVSLPDHFMETLYHDVAALTENSFPITDLSIEAAALLYQAGKGDLVNPDFLENVIATQNPDGSWAKSSDTPGDSWWHSTVLALDILLHIKYPAISYPPMLA
jgi:hypothetical protein